jgi:hypothetical protein
MDSGSRRLTADLDSWTVTLTTGDIVELRAHGVKEDGDDLVFVALMEGSPPFEYELLRLPSRAVVGWSGG